MAIIGFRGFPNLGHSFGVRIIRIIVLGDLYWGPTTYCIFYLLGGGQR